MPNYRRDWVPGGTFFFTHVLVDRRSDLLVVQVDSLRDAVARVRARHPFDIVTLVVLPDHLHAVLRLPDGDADFGVRWRLVKGVFSKALAADEARRACWVARGERGIWQRRFWEHRIRDDRDLAAHVDYCHINPLKHGLVARVRDWPHSTFHREVRAGRLAVDWGGEVGVGPGRGAGEFGEP